jgi:hypothetical protein
VGVSIAPSDFSQIQIRQFLANESFYELEVKFRETTYMELDKKFLTDYEEQEMSASILPSIKQSRCHFSDSPATLLSIIR